MINRDNIINIKVEAHYLIEYQSIGLFIQGTDITSGKHVLLSEDHKWISFPEPGIHRSPWLLLYDAREAEHLAKSLWDANVRPEDALQSGEHRDALLNHLSDMRKLVEKGLEVEL